MKFVLFALLMTSSLAQAEVILLPEGDNKALVTMDIDIPTELRVFTRTANDPTHFTAHHNPGFPSGVNRTLVRYFQRRIRRNQLIENLVCVGRFRLAGNTTRLRTTRFVTEQVRVCYTEDDHNLVYRAPTVTDEQLAVILADQTPPQGILAASAEAAEQADRQRIIEENDALEAMIDEMMEAQKSNPEQE